MQEFLEAIRLRFAMIDIKKSQGALKGKGNEKLNIRNELKIITASDEVHSMWSEMISNQQQGLLTDPETLLPMKDTGHWDADKDGVISREFFKWLGNMTEADLGKLARHLLNSADDRIHPHPKVTLKKNPAILDDCYSAKDWLERHKRKQAVRRHLFHQKPSLGFFDSSGSYNKEAWKAFKVKYNITHATKELLLTEPGEDFFSKMKMPSTKNKKPTEVSPYAKEFFKVFLKTKSRYKKPEARAAMRPYNLEGDVLSPWPEHVWDDHVNSSTKLGFIDFRNVPGEINRETASKEKPYFKRFLDVLKRQTEPEMTAPEVWLWITGDDIFDEQLRAEARSGVFCDNYVPQYSTYIPAPTERVEAAIPSSSRAKMPINLIFLIKRGKKSKTATIPRTFEPSDTPKWKKHGIYREVHHRIYNTELRMEFYLNVISMFCQPRSDVVSIFCGGKIVNACWVCTLRTEPRLSRFDLNSFVFFVISI